MEIRKFETGASRDTEEGKLDYEGFISPVVLKKYAEYMHENRLMPDGSLRDSDNWQKGIGLDVYMKSGFRHFMDWWMEHRGYKSRETLIKALCGLMFNVQGYIYELIKNEDKRSIKEDGIEKAKSGTKLSGVSQAN